MVSINLKNDSEKKKIILEGIIKITKKKKKEELERYIGYQDPYTYLTLHHFYASPNYIIFINTFI